MQNAALSVWQTAIQNAVINMTSGTLSILPNLFGALIVFLLGVVLGNWAKTIIVKSLQMLKIDKIVKDTKFQKFLIKAEVTQKLEEILGSLVKWLLVLTFFVASLNILGLTAISQVLTGVLSYVPSVISAIIVLAVGVLLAGVLEGVVKGALASADLKTARLLGKVTSYVVITIATLVAISELNIAASFINILFIGFVTMLALGLGLAIGLGSKDLIAQILEEWYKNVRKELKK